MTPRSWFLLFSLSAVWGLAFVLVGHAIETVPPMTVAATRVGIAAIGLLCVCAVIRPPMPEGWRGWGALAMMGLLNNAVPFYLINLGQVETGSGLASVLNGFTPIWALLLGWAVLRAESMSLPKIGGLVAALGGLAILVGPSATEGLGGGILGKVAVLGGALSYAVASYWGRRLAGLSVITAATGQLCFSTLMLGGMSLVIDQPWTLTWSVDVVVSLVVLALLCTGIAYMMYFALLRAAGPVNCMMVTYLVPPFAIVMAWVGLGEEPGWRLFVGCALILTGIALATLEKRRIEA
jgi:drug/metabolite transporter (DMT)-like permease